MTEGKGPQEGIEKLQESLEQYFTELYSTLSDDAKNFSSKDFASVDSYMVWKRLQMRRYLGDTLYGGIDKVRLQEVEIQSQEERGGQIEAMVFVKTLFDYRIYRGLPKKARSQEYYTIYKVAAIQEEDGYRILDFSSSDEFYGRVRKFLAEGDAGDRAGNDAAVDAYFEKLQGFQECLERYFIEFYNVLMDGTKDFGHEDFASTNGYIIGRHLVSKRYMANVLFGGMAGVKLEDVFIEDIFEAEDGIELMAYVKISYCYGMDPEDLCSEGEYIRISMLPEENGYQVLDLDSDSDYSKMAKDSLQSGVDFSNRFQNYDAVDDYFEEVNRNADSMLEWQEGDFDALEE